MSLKDKKEMKQNHGYTYLSETFSVQKSYILVLTCACIQHTVERDHEMRLKFRLNFQAKRNPKFFAFVMVWVMYININWLNNLIA